MPPKGSKEKGKKDEKKKGKLPPLDPKPCIPKALSVADGEAALRQDAADGDAAAVDARIRRDIKFNAGDVEHGWQALHMAAAEGHKDVVELLLKWKARVDAQDHRLGQPIHCAAAEGQVAIMDCLLNEGARVDARDVHGLQPIHLAAFRGHLDCVDFILEDDPHLANAVDDFGTSPFHWATQAGHEKCAAMLLQAGGHGVSKARAPGKENVLPVSLWLVEKTMGWWCELGEWRRTRQWKPFDSFVF